MKVILTIFALSLIAMAGEKVTISPGITFTPLDESSAVLANDSVRAITAVTVVWSYESMTTGEITAGVVKTLDNYMLDKRQFRPLVAPGDSLRISPSAAAVQKLADAKDRRITLTVDVVVFEDGEIVGPDRYQIGEDITERYEAAREVSSRFHLGAGRPLDRIADDINALPAQSAARSRWRGHFAGRVLASMRDPKLVTAHLKSLDTLAEPPKFWKNEK